MTEPFTADFVDMRPVRSRSCYKIIMEVDEAMADECLKRLGGLPRAGQSRPVAIVALNEEKQEITAG